MPQFSPQLVHVMRCALEEAMRNVPEKYSNSATRLYFAERILKAAAQGQTRYGDFVAVTGALRLFGEETIGSAALCTDR